jgi:two-component system response regulator
MADFSGKILLVEDAPDDVELSRRVFEKCGMLQDLDVVGDGQAALDYVFGRGAYAERGFALSLKLILLDLKIPIIPGAEVIRQLKSNPQTKNIPIVALTVTGIQREALERGPYPVDGYLRKPLEMHTFLNLYHSYVKK